MAKAEKLESSGKVEQPKLACLLFLRELSSYLRHKSSDEPHVRYLQLYICRTVEASIIGLAHSCVTCEGAHVVRPCATERSRTFLYATL